MSTALRVRKFILLDIKAVSELDGSSKWPRRSFRRPILRPGSPGFCRSSGALDLQDLGPSFFAFREEGSQPRLQVLHHRLAFVERRVPQYLCIVEAEGVSIAPVVWNKRGGAANLLPRHKVENNPAKEWVCIDAADVQIESRIENVDVVLAVRCRHRLLKQFTCQVIDIDY